MGQDDRRRDRHPPGIGPPADGGRLLQLPHHHRHHRMQPKDLLEHGVEVLRPALGDLGHTPVLDARVAGQFQHRPRHRGGRGLVPGRHEGHELVAQLLVRQSLRVGRRGADQQRQEVPPLGQHRVETGCGDLLTEELVDGLQVPHLPAPRPPPAQRGDPQADHHHRAGIDRPGDDRPHPVQARRVRHPEDHPQDHLERQLVEQHVRADATRPRPVVQLFARDLLDERAVAVDLAPPERRREQPPGARVLVTVLEEEGVLAQEGTEQVVALAGVEDRRRAGEHVLDLRGLGHRDDLAPGGHEIERERHPVAPGRRREDDGGSRQGEHRLQDPRKPGAGREPVPPDPGLRGRAGARVTVCRAGARVTVCRLAAHALTVRVGTPPPQRDR